MVRDDGNCEEGLNVFTDLTRSEWLAGGCWESPLPRIRVYTHVHAYMHLGKYTRFHLYLKARIFYTRYRSFLRLVAATGLFLAARETRCSHHLCIYACRMSLDFLAKWHARQPSAHAHANPPSSNWVSSWINHHSPSYNLVELKLTQATVRSGEYKQFFIQSCPIL